MEKRVIELKPIKESTEDFEAIELRLRRLFRERIYLPLMRELASPQRLENAADDALTRALRSGRVTFSRGTFSGRFDADLSRELKKLGAVWSKREEAFKLTLSDMSPELRGLIAATEFKFQEKIAEIDRKLAQILPEEIADEFSGAKLFDRTLWKTERSFQASVRNITVAPQLTAATAKRVSDEWETNMKKWIKDFTEEEIGELRAGLKKSVFAGNRYETAVKTIQKSYGVSANKAKFLARQETSLLMSKFKEVRYTDAGVNEYKWKCVAGSKAHPVRPDHKRLENRVFRWDNPPVTNSKTGARNNPGEDFGCRCLAQPIVRF